MGCSLKRWAYGFGWNWRRQSRLAQGSAGECEQVTLEWSYRGQLLFRALGVVSIDVRAALSGSLRLIRNLVAWNLDEGNRFAIPGVRDIEVPIGLLDDGGVREFSWLRFERPEVQEMLSIV